MAATGIDRADVAVLIPAAGKSLRYRGGADGGRSKLAERIGGAGGKSVLAWAVGAFLARRDVGQVVVAAGDVGGVMELLGEAGRDERVRVVMGGSCRAESVRSALAGVRKEMEWVAVHDGARPAVSGALIERVFAAARKFGAAGPATAVALTIKEAQGPLPAKIGRTLPRQALWAMQTPQVMRREDLAAAFERCPVGLETVTDDLQLLELAGMDAVLVEGEEGNVKITHAGDLEVAERVIRGRLK